MSEGGETAERGDWQRVASALAEGERVRLVGALTRGAWVAGLFAVTFGPLAWFTDSPRLLAGAGISAGWVLAAVYAAREAKAGRASRAAGFLMGCYLVAAVPTAAVIPPFSAAIVIGLVVAFFVALLHLSPRLIRGLLFVGPVVGIGVVVVAKVGPPGNYPLWEEVLFRAVSVAGVLYVAEYLLVRFSESLRAWMDEVLASGKALERAEGSARFGEELFRGIYGANAIGMVLSADDGAIVDANDHYLAMIGFSRPEVQAGLLSWKAITPPEWEAANERAVAELQASGSVTPFEKEYFRKNGSRVPVLMGSARIASRALNLTYVINLSAQKRAERALRFLADASRVLAEHAQPMERRLAEVAALAAADLGRACRIDLLVAPQRHTRVAQAFRNPETEAAIGAGGGLPDALVEEVAESGEVRTRPVSGAGLDPWSQMIGVPLRAHDRVLGAIVLVIDGAEQDGEVRAVAYELAGRIALAVEAERLFQQAQDAVRLRDEFLSIASHELRTPLTPLQLQLTMLKKRAGSIAVDEGAEKFLVGRLDLIQRQCDRLTRLIVDLLDISRLAEGRLQLQLEELDLGGVLDEVIEAFRGSGDLARSGSTIELARTPVVGRWDRVRVEQLVTNLLSNALKYGAGKPVRLRLSVEGAHAVLEVKDEGIGIAPADQDRVFGRFERAVSARHYGGLGLGLYIVRQVVEAMGGTIELDSRVGEGARFVVRLPLAGPAAALSQAG